VKRYDNAFHPRPYCILTISHNSADKAALGGRAGSVHDAEAEHCWTQRMKGTASYERVVDAKYLEEIRAAAK
jgi:hypothetical protein